MDAPHPPPHTRRAYQSDLDQFLAHAGIAAGAWEQLAAVRPAHISDWRDALAADEQTNSSIRRKLTALRSLFSYLKTYGYTGANPAHSDSVTAPKVPRDGKTVGLSVHDCRRLLDAPKVEDQTIKARQAKPAGRRPRPRLLAVLAYSGCRVGELVKLEGAGLPHQWRAPRPKRHRQGQQGCTTPLRPEAVERLAAWLELPGIRDDAALPLFRPQQSARNHGRDGFRPRPITTRAVEKLIGRYVEALGLDANVTVHSLRVTALTTARERGSDIIDLQDFAGHADPRTTLTHIRSRDRLSKRPAYVLKY